MDPYKKTFDTWNKVAVLYEEKFMDLDWYNESYDRFCQLIPKPNASILEIGCGPGNITKYLLSQRPDLQIHGVDIAPNMIELARKNNPTATFEVMDARDISQLRSGFDGIMAGFCAPYLAKEDMVQFYQDSAALLPAGGIFYCSTIKGDYSTSGYRKGSTGDECFVYFYDENFLSSQLSKNYLQQEDLIYKHISQPDGTTLTEMIMIAKKAEGSCKL